MILLEVCANSITSALAAQNGGAQRVELCENLNDGGTTPSAGQILIARKQLHIKLFVLIRPRSGDFLYTDVEFEVMKADVQYCAYAGCNGVVIGMLKADGTIDKERCAELIKIARQSGLGVTFHRAFDVCADQFKALEDVIELGCDRILTSGGKSTAMEGSAVIVQLIKKANGRIKIMAGSGINEHNVADLVHFTKVTEIHGSAKKPVESGMNYKNDHILMGVNYETEYVYEQTDEAMVKAILKEANK